MSDSSKYNNLSELIIECIEGTISQERFASLQEQLDNDPDALSYYSEYMRIYTNLRYPGDSELFEKSPEEISSTNFDTSFWEALAINERSAESVPVEEPKAEKSEPQFTEKRKIVQRRRRVSRLSLYTAMGSIAALALMLVYVYTHPRQRVQTVATVIDAIDATWGQSYETIVIGSRLSNNKELNELIKGLVQIELDGGAEIIVEGPAEFTVETPGQVFLVKGKLTANVPENAIGFIVETPTSQIVDLGTEFGTFVSNDGSSEIHMFKGKASLSAHDKGFRTNERQILTEGMAKKIDTTGQITDIRSKRRTFTRHLSERVTPTTVFYDDFDYDDKATFISKGWEVLEGVWNEYYGVDYRLWGYAKNRNGMLLRKITDYKLTEGDEITITIDRVRPWVDYIYKGDIIAWDGSKATVIDSFWFNTYGNPVKHKVTVGAGLNGQSLGFTYCHDNYWGETDSVRLSVVPAEQAGKNRED